MLKILSEVSTASPRIVFFSNYDFKSRRGWRYYREQRCNVGLVEANEALKRVYNERCNEGLFLAIQKFNMAPEDYFVHFYGMHVEVLENVPSETCLHCFMYTSQKCEKCKRKPPKDEIQKLKTIIQRLQHRLRDKEAQQADRETLSERLP